MAPAGEAAQRDRTESVFANSFVLGWIAATPIDQKSFG